ncbi:hypothetical protein BH11PLA2_BH11PLA2_44400 [soil metagenome]
MTLVSIIIPCYRQGHWLAETVHSALAQTHTPLEVIVVNDGSDDDTETVAKNFGDRIRYVYQTNQGHCAARNAGLRESRGEFILFLDGDDLLQPEAIAKLLSVAMMDLPRMAMMGWRPFVNDVAEPATESLPNCKTPVAALLEHNPGPPATMLLPRQTLERIGGVDVTLKSVEDWDLYVRALFAGTDLVAVPFVGAYYRQSPMQMSKNELVMTENMARVLARLADLAARHPDRLREWGLDPATAVAKFRHRTASEYAHLAHQYRQRGDHRLAAKQYWQCMAYGRTIYGLKGLLKLPWHALRGPR